MHPFSVRVTVLITLHNVESRNYRAFILCLVIFRDGSCVSSMLPIHFTGKRHAATYDKKGDSMTSPSARVAVTTTQKSVARLKVFNYGEDPRVANEGDLLIVSENSLGEAGTQSQVQFEITIRGRDMSAFNQSVQKALGLWEANKDYLLQPATRLLSPAIYGQKRGQIASA